MEPSNYKENFLTYSGPFSMRIISVIGKFLVDNLDAPQLTKIRVYRVLIELTQNVSLYSANRFANGNVTTIGEGFLGVAINEHFIKLTTRNKILKEHSSVLIQNCQGINQSTEEALKEKKHKLRRESTFLETGAHIGLITICLMSHNPLQFEIDNDGNAEYFNISSIINKA